MENIKIELSNTSPGVIHVLQGVLPKPWNRETQVISGNIHAPIQWLSKRLNCVFSNESYNKDSYLPSCTYVIMDMSDRKILLVVDEGSQNEVKVLGQFILNPEIEKLRLNNPDKPYESYNELYRVLKFSSHLFENKEAHRQLLVDLQNYNQKVTVNIKQHDDNRGNSGASIENSLDVKPLIIDLLMPVFIGESKVSLRVEAEITIRNGKPLFYLTCYELTEIISNYTDAFFETMIQEFGKLGPYPIIIK